MQYIIYFILAFFATTVGSLTGMGGGIIIKPLMDMLGDFDVQTIFLGIGGGPINVALIIYLFSYSTKTATVCSLITILFAQITRLGITALSTGFDTFDLSVVPLMALGAVLGGFIGAVLNKRLSEKMSKKPLPMFRYLFLQ